MMTSSVRVGRDLGDDLINCVRGHPIILPGLQFPLKGELGHLLEEILQISRG